MGNVYTAPGVYIEEAPSSGAPITGNPIGIMGMQGVSNRGPADEVTKIKNWTEFVSVFGSYITGGALAYVYRNFLDNGGGDCYIRRPTRTSSVIATENLENETPADCIKIEAKSFGTWGNSLKVEVDWDPQGDTLMTGTYTGGTGPDEIVVASVVGFTVGEWFHISESAFDEYRQISSINSSTKKLLWTVGGSLTNSYTAVATVKSLEFKLIVYETIDGTDYAKEIWAALSMVDTLDNFYETIVNDEDYPATLGSNYITITEIGSLTGNFRQPVEQTISLSTGAEGTQDASGDAVFTSFDTVIDSMTAMAAPGAGASVHTAGIVYAEGKNCVFLVDTPATTVKAGAITYRNETLGSVFSYGMLYWPNFVVVDPIGTGNNPEKTISCVGGVLGRTAYMHTKRGVWRAPAGTPASIVGIKRLYVTPTVDDQKDLNPIGVNVIRPIQNINRIFGARTLESPPADWKYSNIRYSFSYIEKSVKEGTAWVNFEANDKPLWNKIKGYVRAYLTILGQAGAFEGKKESEWFFVVCDDSINTEQQKATGYVLCQIGLALVRPAEFMVFTFSQLTNS